MYFCSCGALPAGGGPLCIYLNHGQEVTLPRRPQDLHLPELCLSPLALVPCLLRPTPATTEGREGTRNMAGNFDKSRVQICIHHANTSRELTIELLRGAPATAVAAGGTRSALPAQSFITGTNKHALIVGSACHPATSSTSTGLQCGKIRRSGAQGKGDGESRGR